MPKINSVVAVLMYVQPLFIPAADTSAQVSIADRAGILQSVIQHRMDFLGDTTRFDGCTLGTFQLSSSDTSSLSPSVRAVLSDRRCGDKALRNKVHVTSVSAHDSLATVSLSVTRGEELYKEKYFLFKVGRRMATWSIREMRQFDFDQLLLR